MLTSRVLNLIFFVLVFCILFFLLNSLLYKIYILLGFRKFSILNEKIELTTIISILISISIYSYSNLINNRMKNFIIQCIDELSKSYWPTWSETKMNVFIVILASVVMAVILGIFDLLFLWLTESNFFLEFILI
jgi:preprotein translocase SecE subunit